jgi:hypothetical protein
MSVTKPAAVLAAALFLVAGCSSTGNPTGSSAASAPAADTPSADTPTASSRTGSAPLSTPSSKSTTSSASGQGGGTSRCHTAGLKVSWAADPGGGAAGSQGSFLIFTNTSKSTCTLYGYPGVSFVAGDKGTQVGDAFTRSPGGQQKLTVTVAAGKTAYSQLVLVNEGVYDKAACRPVQVRGFRVYPPDETAAVFVSSPQTACSAKGKGVGRVVPIVAGSPAT